MKKFSSIFLGSALLAGCGRPQPVAISPPQQTFEHDYGLQMSRGEFETRGRNGTVSTRLENGQLLKQHFENGQLQGTCTCSFPYSKQTAYSETYKQGKLAFRVDYFANGMPHLERTYLPSQVEEVKSWYEDGVPRTVECFRGQQLLQGTYFDPSATAEAEIVDGVGDSIQRSPAGVLLERIEMREGYPNLRRVYYASGEIKEFYRYKTGLLDGECRFYSEGGVPESFQCWVQGKRDGLTKFFHQGELVAQVPYRENKKCGTEKRFCNNALVESADWKDDQLHGPCFQFDKTETVISQTFYYKNRVVSKAVYESLVVSS